MEVPYVIGGLLLNVRFLFFSVVKMAPYTVTTTVQEELCDSRDISNEKNGSNKSNNLNVSESTLDSCDQPVSNGYFVTELKWLNVISITVLHLIVIQGLVTFPYFQKWKMFLFSKYPKFILLVSLYYF